MCICGVCLYAGPRVWIYLPQTAALVIRPFQTVSEDCFFYFGIGTTAQCESPFNWASAIPFLYFCTCFIRAFLGVTAWCLGGSGEGEFGAGAWSTSSGSGAVGVGWCVDVRATAGLGRQTVVVSPPGGQRHLRSTSRGASSVQLFTARIDGSARLVRAGRGSLWLARLALSFINLLLLLLLL